MCLSNVSHFGAECLIISEPVIKRSVTLTYKLRRGRNCKLLKMCSLPGCRRKGVMNYLLKFARLGVFFFRKRERRYFVTRNSVSTRTWTMGIRTRNAGLRAVRVFRHGLHYDRSDTRPSSSAAGSYGSERSLTFPNSPRQSLWLKSICRLLYHILPKLTPVSLPRRTLGMLAN